MGLWARIVNKYANWGNWHARAVDAYQKGQTGWGNWFTGLDALSYASGNTPIIKDFVINATDWFDVGTSWGTKFTSLGQMAFDTVMLAPDLFYKGVSNVFRVPHYAVKLSFAKTLPLFSFQPIKTAASAKILLPGSRVFNIVSKSFKAPVSKILGVIGYAKSFFDIGRYLSQNNQFYNSLLNIENLMKSNVGGVLFDQSAEVLTDLEEITGAYWDEEMGQLVLVGKKNGKTEELFLPRMDKDHLAVAMRAVFTNDNIGVSIDPPPGYEESGEFPPDKAKMPVRYLGNTQGTLFGAIMFEADRLLKNLSMGKDNETEKEVTSQVAGFRNELDLSITHKTDKSHAWTRMWFVIEDMRLCLEVKETSDRNALVFGKATLKVKAEYLNKEKNQGTNPAAEQFAKHFTLHFDEFAKEYPILERLKEIAKIAAIAKYLKDSGKPVDLSFLDDYEFIKVKTPETTPGIISSKTWPVAGGTHTHFLYGGVDFDFEYKPARDDGEARRLREFAQKSKPCGTTLRWDFQSNGKVKRALAVPLARRNGNFTTTHTDLSFPSSNGLRLELLRFYDSFNTRPTLFGYGWDLIPYKLLILKRETKTKLQKPTLFLIDKRAHKTHKYTFVKDKNAYFLVKEESKGEGRETLFTYDPQNFVRENPEGGFSWESGRTFYNFDSQGILVSVGGKNNAKVNYTYQNNQLVKISDNSGRSICLTYDQQNRIKQATLSDQRVIDYIYDIYGDLIKVLDNGKEVISYTYDDNHRLIKIKDNYGKIVLRNCYDPLGRVVKKERDLVADNGRLITRIYDDNHHLIKEEDKEGNNISYEYDRHNNLVKTTINDRWRRKTILEHDAAERVKKVINPLGHSVRFNYDTPGNLTSITDAKGHTQTFKYDNNGNLILFRDALGNEWKQEFDELSRLKKITDPLGQTVSLTYKDNRVVSIETQEGKIRYEYDREGNVAKINDSNSNFVKLTYDSNNNLIRIKDSFGRVIKYTYDSAGNLASITGPQGNNTYYECNQLDRSLKISTKMRRTLA